MEQEKVLVEGYVLVSRLVTYVSHGKPTEQEAMDWLNKVSAVVPDLQKKILAFVGK